MEEKNETSKRLTYEQLEQIALQLQDRVMQSEARLASIDIEAMRLDYLFKVLDKASLFPQGFIDKCVAEITAKLEIRDNQNIEEK